jgi:exodeoxyribonuclease V gamma subunit
MLSVHRSEDAAALVGALAEVLAEVPADPFQPEVVAVPTRGIERWITQQLSLRLGAASGNDGIAAHIQFPPPRVLVGRTLAAADDGAGEAWRSRNLVWPVLETLDASLDEPWLALVARFVRGSGAAAIGSRRMEAANKIAGLFASYGRHHPELIRAWAGGADTGPDGAPVGETWAWQPLLWRRVRDRIGIPSPAESLDSHLETITSGEVEIDLPPRVCVYGLTSLPVTQLRVVEALSHQREVHLFLLHPSPALWETTAGLLPGGLPLREDDPTAEAARHPLLASWGRDARELQILLAGAGASGGTHHTAPASDPATLLGHLQAGIRSNARPADPLPELAADDRSIQVHSCHGPTRQVAALRDALLHLLADDPTLEPRDIVVMCPDIEAYAPLIEAAFEPDPARTPAPGAAGIPDVRVRLADRAPVRVNPLAFLMVALLRLAASRVTACDILGFAALGPVRRRFGFDDDLLATAAGLVDEMEVSWGLDESHRAGLGLPGRPERTWIEGLERLLAGVMTEDRSVALVGPRLPLRGVEGGEVEVVGRLAELLSRVGAATRAMAEPMTAGEWRTVLAEAVGSLGDTTPDHAWQWRSLDRVLDARLGEWDEDAPGPRLTLAEVTHRLAPLGEGRATIANHRTGDLTVCTLLPMRSVPHRVVALLGMDDGLFPRSPGDDGDDLLAIEPRVGTRDRGAEDRQMLLDAVLAARDHLVITYSGNDEHTNASRPPSVPVAELLDAIDETVGLPEGEDGPARDRVLIRHPLQPFDPRNFGAEGDPPRSFDRHHLAGARALTTAVRAAEPGWMAPTRPPDWAVLELGELQRFLEHPVQSFVDRRLGFRYPRDEEAGSDTLPVELDSLQQWGVGQRLLDGEIDDHDLGALQAAEIGRGSLPPGRLGTELIPDIQETVAGILAAAEAAEVPLPARGSRQLEVVLADGRRVTGPVAGISGHTLATVQFGKVRAKHLTSSYLRLVALTAAEPETRWRAVLVGKDEAGGGRIAAVTVGPLGGDAAERAERAAAALEVLIDLFDRGMREPLPLFSGTSHAYVTAADDRKVAIAAKKWLPGTAWGRPFPQEQHDPHHLLAFGGPRPLTDFLTIATPSDERPPEWPEADNRFEALAKRLWLPILTACGVGDG